MTFRQPHRSRRGGWKRREGRVSAFMTQTIQAKLIYCKASSTGADEMFSNCSFTISLLKLWIFSLGSTCSILCCILLFYSPCFLFSFNFPGNGKASCACSDVDKAQSQWQGCNESINTNDLDNSFALLVFCKSFSYLVVLFICCDVWCLLQDEGWICKNSLAVINSNNKAASSL